MQVVAFHYLDAEENVCSESGVIFRPWQFEADAGGNVLCIAGLDYPVVRQAGVEVRMFCSSSALRRRVSVQRLPLVRAIALSDVWVLNLAFIEYAPTFWVYDDGGGPPG